MKRLLLALFAIVALPISALAQGVDNPSAPNFPPNKNSFCVTGDSISEEQTTQLLSYSGATVAEDSNRGWNVWLAALTGQAVSVDPANNYAAAGYTSADVLAHIGTAIAAKCGAYSLMVGVNDCNGGVAPATTQANYNSIVQALWNTGAVVYVSTILPWDSSTQSKRDCTWQNNAYIRNTFSTRPGVVVVDPAFYYGDPASATNAPKTGYTQLGDAIHPSGLGGYWVAQPFIAPVKLFFAPKLDPVTSVTDVYSATSTMGNLLAGMPLQVANAAGSKGTGVSGSVATSWNVDITAGTSGNTGTLAVAASVCETHTCNSALTADGRIWQQLVLSGAITQGGGGICTGSVACVSALTYVKFNYTNAGVLSNISPGDQVRAECLVQIDPGVANVNGINLEIWWYDGTTQYWTGTLDGIPADALVNPVSTVTLYLRTRAFTAPATNTFSDVRVMLTFPNSASYSPTGTFRVGNCALRKMQ